MSTVRCVTFVGATEAMNFLLGSALGDEQRTSVQAAQA
jgi:hypothetical protein